MAQTASYRSQIRVATAAALLLIPGIVMSQALSKQIKVTHIREDLTIEKLDHAAWKNAETIEVTKYWSGDDAPEGRRFRAWLLWSDKALYVRFAARNAEPLVVSEKPDRAGKTIGLWDRDVCEIFIAPRKDQPNKYFEFEIAPTGEWIDLGIEITPKERITDWKYRSGMESAVNEIGGETVAAIKIPFASLGGAPKSGDVWLANIFRCVGKDPTRGYLAWRPTKTEVPSFHVPGAFGEFVFSK